MAEKKEILNVPSWVLESKYAKPMVEELLKCDIEYLDETEKAVKVLFSNENVSEETWLPKNTKKGKPIVQFKK